LALLSNVTQEAAAPPETSPNGDEPFVEVNPSPIDPFLRKRVQLGPTQVRRNVSLHPGLAPDLKIMSKTGGEEPVPPESIREAALHKSVSAQLVS
jgi:hypothetical protein